MKDFNDLNKKKNLDLQGDWNSWPLTYQDLVCVCVCVCVLEIKSLLQSPLQNILYYITDVDRLMDVHTHTHTHIHTHVHA